MKIVPDTSAIIHGTLLEELKKAKKNVELIIPLAALDELQAQASKGREVGFIGLEQLKEVRKICERKRIKIKFEGERPSLEDIKLAHSGRIDAMIRDVAKKNNAYLYTCDYVQALVAEAEGVKVKYFEIPVKTSGLKFEDFFTEDTISVHLKENCVPLAKRGKPGNFKLVEVGDKKLTYEEISEIIREISEAARISEQGSVEINRSGATVIQLGNYRIAIARPPFSDGLEVTIVRPIVKLRLEDYKLSEKLLQRLREEAAGIIIAGPPGSGKCIGLSMPILSEECVPKSLNAIKKGVMALSQDKLVPSEIEKLALDFTNTLLIRTRSGRRIIVSEEHPLLVADGRDLNWKLSKDLKIGEKIAVLRKLDFKGENIRLPLDRLRDEKIFVVYDGKIVNSLEIEEFKDGMKIFYCGKNGRKSKEINLPLTLTEELAELYGYMLSEGSGDDLAFTNASEKIVGRFKELMKKVFGLSDEDFYTFKRISIRVRRGKMVEEFFRRIFEIPKRKKSTNSDIPEFLLKADLKVISKFLRAYVDGDGSISRSGIEISTASRKIAEKICFLLLRFGIFAFIKERVINGKEYYRVLIQDASNVRKFYLSIGTLTKEEKFAEFLERKSSSNIDLIPAGGIFLKCLKLLNMPYEKYYLNKNEYRRERFFLMLARIISKYKEFLDRKKEIFSLLELSNLQEEMRKLIEKAEEKIIERKRFYKKYRKYYERIKLWRRGLERPRLSTLLKLYTAINREFGSCEKEVKLINKWRKRLTSLKELYKLIFRNSLELTKNKEERRFITYLMNKKDILNMYELGKVEKIVKLFVLKYVMKMKSVERNIAKLFILFNEYILWDEVVEIRNSGKQEVFDLKVKNYSNFFVGTLPVLVHNSTFAASLAEFYRSLGKVVKTLESPRDMQVSDEITQYGPLEGDFEKTADILLLVRPDYTIFDEVRKTKDFEIFSDLRLAGVGMVGVVHATNPIDAIQRFISRVDIGVLPHIVDTVIFIKDGEIKKVYELSLKVKVPTGMTQEDLARPVVEVRDFETGKLEYEIYTFGEENVVVPVEKERVDVVKKLAEERILMEIRKYDPRASVEIIGNKAVVKVDNRVIGRLIGKDGENISRIERKLGLRVEVMPKYSTLGKEVSYQISESGNSIEFIFDKSLAGEVVSFYIDGNFLFSAMVGKKGTIKISKESDIGKELLKALYEKKEIRVFGKG